jgi:hypothetical protein
MAGQARQGPQAMMRLDVGKRHSPPGRAPLNRQTLIALSAIAVALTACTPTVKVEAPDKPITINLNVKIEHEIRIKVDRELDDLFEEDKGLF